MYHSSHSERTGICSVCNGCGRCSGRSFSPLESAASSYQGSFSSSGGTYRSQGSTFSYSIAPTKMSYAPEMARIYAVNPAATPRIFYETTKDVQGYRSNRMEETLFFPTHREYAFMPDNFLKPGQGSKFVGQAEEVKEFVEEAFQLLFKTPFPDDLKISVLDAERFRTLAPHPSTIGLSINRRQLGLMSEIFVLNGSLGTVMLTIGHELGHVLTATLPTPHEEEAKAYAFSLEWMRVIKEHNVANLKDALILEQPAENGLHNVAFRFVHDLIKSGLKAAEVYRQLVRKQRISIAT